jgi:hypothetical protein
MYSIIGIVLFGLLVLVALWVALTVIGIAIFSIIAPFIIRIGTTIWKKDIKDQEVNNG